MYQILGITLLLFPNAVWAANQISFTRSTNNIIKLFSLSATILEKFQWALGGAFIVSAWIHYMQYQKNPSQVPFSKPVTLLLLGCASIGMALLSKLSVSAL